VQGVVLITLKRGGVAEALNAAEWRRGALPAQRWDGREERIGNPRPAGSRLKGDEVLTITVATL